MPIATQDEALQALKEVIDFFTRSTQQPTVVQLSEPTEFDRLKLLVENSQWPEAAPDHLICANTEEEKTTRAAGILELAVEHLGALAGKKVLDFGCGEGHVVKALAAAGAVATGYDIAKQWGDEANLTTDWQHAKAQGPFDAIVLYDVLDHCQDAVAALNQMKEAMTPETRVYCRCHPWPGPHASHYYKQLNKAYIHLVFTDDELRRLGVEPQFSQKTWFPHRDAEAWFTAAGLRAIGHKMHNVRVNPFFKDTPLIADRITKQSPHTSFPEWQMSQSFNDFLLVLR